MAYTFLMFIWFSLPAFLTPVIDELGLTGTQAGIVVGAIPLTYIPLALLSGLFVDRIGPGRSLALGALCFGLAQIGRSTAGGFPSLLLFTILIGVGATAITFGLPKLVSVLFPPDQTGFPSSVYLIGAQLGSVIVFGVGRPVLGPAVGGWRPLFLWSGILAIGYGCLWYLLARASGIDSSTGSGQTAEPSADGDGTGNGFAITDIVRDLRIVLSHRELQLIVVIGTMYLLINHSIKGWLPTILEVGGHTPAVAGQVTTVYVIGMVAGIFAIPALADRTGHRRLAVAASGGIVAIGVAGLATADAIWLTVLAVIVAGVGTGGLSPMIRAIPPELEGIGAKLTGTAVGFVFAVGEIGGFLGPVLVGGLHDHTGSFLPGLVLITAAAVVVVAAGETLRRWGATSQSGE